LGATDAQLKDTFLGAFRNRAKDGFATENSAILVCQLRNLWHLSVGKSDSSEMR